MPAPKVEIGAGDTVHIDGCEMFSARVLAVAFYVDHIEAKVSWFANAVLQEQWIEIWRLTVVKAVGEENYPRLPTNK